MHAFSDAISICIIAAEFLVNNSEATIKDMESKVSTVDGMQKVEMIITLKRISPRAVSQDEQKEKAV